jgi:hypothetical protein
VRRRLERLGSGRLGWVALLLAAADGSGAHGAVLREAGASSCGVGCWWLLPRAGKREAESRREDAEWERGGNPGGGGVEEEGRGLFPMAAAAKG